ncbi:MAG: hypothetical protein Q8L88_08010, partial [Bacteroidota bacterium]|nr:hypothetical protein [Bacteroidota bacterium]
KQIVRIGGTSNGKQQRIALDISNANVEVVDTLEHGSDLCVIKVNQWGNSIIRQIDSLIVPLSVAVKRDGKTTRSFSASQWNSLSSVNLPEVKDGDIITFSLEGKAKKSGFYNYFISGKFVGKRKQ